MRTKLYVSLLALATTGLLASCLSGCATAPSGPPKLSESGKVALETSARIAVRHAIADSPRAAEKAAHIRVVLDKVQAVTAGSATLAGLRDAVVSQLDQFNLSPADRADAVDLLQLFYVALQEQLGDKLLDEKGLVAVVDFLNIVRSVLPPAS